MTAAMLTQNASHEAERVHALDELGVAGTAREERFDRITRLAQQLFCVSMAAVTLVDRDVQWLESEQGVGLESTSPPGHDLQRHDRQPGHHRRRGRQPGHPVRREPLRHRRAARPLLRRAPAHRSWSLPRRHPLLIDETPRTFSEPRRALLRELGVWAEAELTSSAEMARAAEVQRAVLPRVGSISVPG